MHRNRKNETDEERRERLESAAQIRTFTQAAEERTIDEMIRQSIQLHGA